MKYEGYTSLDFANDVFFIRWVRRPDAESDFFWKTFLRENPSRLPAIDEARQLILSLDRHRATLSEETLVEMRNKLWMHFRAEKESDGPPKHAWRWWLAAACLAFFLATASYFIPEYTMHQPTIISPSDGAVEGNIVRHGRNSVILLSDGSRIWLKDSSTIEYRANFMDHPTRDVFLEGEAFFEVAKDVDHPFIVHTATLKIKVVGTTFSVRSYAEDKTVETTLVSGMVHIEQADAHGTRVGDIELKPNQKAVFNKVSKVINVRQIETVPPATWKRNRLVFDEEPVATVLQQLEKWYGVQIHLDTGKLDCKLTATIEKESLKDVLTMLSVSHGIAFDIDGDDVYITGVFCK